MLVDFIKMNALGNDFVIIDNRQKNYSFNSSQIAKMTNRKTGIGCDQLVLIEKTTQQNADIYMKIFNIDGSISEACGNVTRCVASIIMDQKNTNEANVQTDFGILNCQKENEQFIWVNMGKPFFAADDGIDLKDGIFGLKNPFYVQIGNPHCVIVDNDQKIINDDALFNQLGQKIESCTETFPNKTNVEFIKIIDDFTIKITKC